MYTDPMKTGRTMIGRTGIQALIEAAKSKPKPFDYILIDETSRWGRNMADVFRILDVLDHHGVYLYFLGEDLDSSQPTFRDAYTMKVRQDEQFSKNLSRKIRGAQSRRFKEGYTPGGTCYGYRNVPILDATRKGRHGGQFVIAVKLEIDPEQDKIVRLIFQSYVDGKSIMDIVKMLNADSIPPPKRPRKNRNPAWSLSGIQCILENQNYCGLFTWGRVKSCRNPETGKTENRPVPASEWEHSERPDLRIISDEIWNAAQERRAVRAARSKSLGGMSRTAASRTYIFSGRLECGECGGNISITGGDTKRRYGCATHRVGGKCSNKATILQEELEGRLIEALSSNLQTESLREEIVQGLMEYFRTMRSKQLGTTQTAEQTRAALEESRRNLRRQHSNLIETIKTYGGSRGMTEECAQLEARIERIEDQFASIQQAPVYETTEAEVREFLDSKALSFQEVLLGAPEAVKQALQQMVSTITLTPFEDERGTVYRVTGDVDLFAMPHSVMHTSTVSCKGVHYTIPIAVDILARRASKRLPLAA